MTTCLTCHDCGKLAVWENGRHLTKPCPDCHIKPEMHWFPCGCLLQEGEQHYCTERQQGVIVLPRHLCEHEHWDPRTESCAQCGLTREQREQGALETVQP